MIRYESIYKGCRSFLSRRLRMKMRYLATVGSLAYLVSIVYAFGANGYMGNLSAGIIAAVLIPIFHYGFKHQAVRLPKMRSDYLKYDRAAMVWLIIASVVHFCSAILLQNNPQASVYAIMPILGLVCVLLVMLSQEIN